MLNAEYYLTHTDLNNTTPWDYDAPETGPLARTQVDTSAAAIAASGLLDLAKLCPDPVKAEAYRRFAVTSLESLCKLYLGDKTPGFEGILNGAVYHIHKNIGVHEACLFGEYFFVEALWKALQVTPRPPITGERVVAYPEDSLPETYKTWTDGPTEEDLVPAYLVGGQGRSHEPTGRAGDGRGAGDRTRDRGRAGTARLVRGRELRRKRRGG